MSTDLSCFGWRYSEDLLFKYAYIKTWQANTKFAIENYKSKPKAL
jgi:hypothetical protein